MKNLPILLLSFLVLSCNLMPDSTTFNSSKLNGKYKVDLSPITNSIKEEEDSDDGAEQLAKGLAMLAISSIDMKVTFYENNKGILEVGGGFIDFANAFSNKSIEKIQPFVYKVDGDNTLFVKKEGDDEFEELATIRTYSDTYDYIQLYHKSEDGKETHINLSKMTE